MPRHEGHTPRPTRAARKRHARLNALRTRKRARGVKRRDSLRTGTPATPFDGVFSPVEIFRVPSKAAD